MANNPTVLLADEPTAASDTERGKIVMSLLRKLSRERSPRNNFAVFRLFAGQSGKHAGDPSHIGAVSAALFCLKSS